MKTSLNRAMFWFMEACYFTAYYYQTPIQLSYILTFGVTGTLLGIVSSLSSVISVLVIPIVPYLTRKFGVRPVFIAGFVLQILFFGFYWFANSIAMIIIANIMNGMAFGITMVLMASAVVAIYPPEKSGAVLSIYTMLQALGQAIATSAGIYVSAQNGYRGNYLVSTVFSIACLALCMAMSDLGQSAEEASDVSRRDFKPDVALYPLLGLCLFCGVIMSIVQSYTEPFARFTGNIGGLGLYFVVFSGTMAVIRLFLAATIKKLPVSKAALILCPTVGISLVLMNYQQSAFALLLSAAFAAIGVGCLQTLAQYKVFQCYPAHARNKASSMFYFGFYGGMVVGTFSGAILFTGATKPMFFLFYAAMALLPTVCAAAIALRKAR